MSLQRLSLQDTRLNYNQIFRKAVQSLVKSFVQVGGGE